MNLDQVLAFDVPTYRGEYQKMRATLNALVEDPKVQGTSIATSVVPAANALKSWLRLFESSMRQPDKRLAGSTRMRVCFAERGMFLVLTLLASVREELAILKGEDKSERVMQLRRMLTQFMRTILGCDSKGLTFMRNWLSTLVDIVPLDVRSHNTTLTTENIRKLDLFCRQ